MRRAFTLFEVILVMALIVLIASVSYPSLESMYSYYRVQAAADTLRGSLAEARTRAMEEGQAYRFSVVPGKGNFRVAPDAAEYWTDDVPKAADPNNPPLVQSGVLAKGIRFRRADTPSDGSDGDTALPVDSVASSQWNSLAVFLPDGTAREDVTIVLEGSGARPLVVRLRALTGGVSVRPLEGGGR